MFAINARTALFATRLMNAAEEGSVGGTAPEAPKLSRTEKLAAQIKTLETRIEADTAKLATVKQELETAERLSAVGVGTLITARVGRAETAREVAAEVVGVKDDDSGRRLYKISFGDGFDAEITVIQPHQIIAVTGQIGQ